MNDVFEDGKFWKVRYTKTGTRIRSEIPPAHTHPKVDTAQMALLKKIANALVESGIMEGTY